MLLDNGAGMSLITSRLANSLKARRVRAPQQIAGLAGELTSNDALRVNLGTTFGRGGESIDIVAQVVDCITPDYPPQDLRAIRDLPFLKDLTLADLGFGTSGRVDLLLGIVDSNRCTLDESVSSSSDRTIRAWNTIFGWAVGGETEGPSTSNVCMRVTAADVRGDELKQRIWLVDEVPGDALGYDSDEKRAADCFQDTIYREPDGRYVVQLPRKISPPKLGESRSLALKRYNHNEKALKQKGRWEDFAGAIQEYGQLGHAELVPPEELQKDPSSTFYFPMHGVLKEASTTTKLRVVFDASAKSKSGASLNDTPLPGPSLFSLLSSILTKFRVSHRYVGRHLQDVSGGRTAGGRERLPRVSTSE